MRGVRTAAGILGVLLSFQTCTKDPQANRAADQKATLKQQARERGYAVFVQPPDELKQLLKEQGLYRAFLAGRTTEITPQLEKLIPQIPDSTLQAHLHLLCGIVRKGEWMALSRQQLQRKIFHLNRAIHLTKDTSMRCFIYPMLAELYQRADSLPQALHILQLCVEECPGIGEGEHRFSLAASVVGDLCTLMEQLKIPVEDQLHYLQGIISKHPSDEVGLSALYWTARLAKAYGKTDLSVRLRQEALNYPPDLRKRYPGLWVVLKDSVKNQREEQ